MAESLLSSLKDAETSQRGYLISGDKRYLKNVKQSSEEVKEKLVELRGITPESDALDEQLDTLERLASERLVQLQDTLELRRQFPGDEGLLKAKEKVLENARNELMDDIRDVFADIKEHQRRLLISRARSGPAGNREPSIDFSGPFSGALLIAPRSGCNALRSPAT